MPDQIQLVVKSLKDFKNNLVLLAPILLSFGLYLVLAIFIGVQFLIGFLIFGRDTGFSGGLAIYAIFFYTLDIIIAILINVYVTAAQYGMIGDVALKVESSLRRMLQHGKTLFKPVLTFIVAELAIAIVPAALLALLAFIAFLFSNVAGYVLAAVFGLLYILFLIAFSVMTMFSIPILVSRKIGGFKVIMEAFRYGKSNFEHVITTLAVVVVLWIIISVIETIVYIPAFVTSIASELTPGAVAALPLSLTSILFSILSSIVSAIGGIVILLYIFNSYFSKNPFKNWK